jgi:hypothetical protein
MNDGAAIMENVIATRPLWREIVDSALLVLPVVKRSLQRLAPRKAADSETFHWARGL